MHLSVVFTFHVGQLLVLLVLQGKLLVSIFLDMISQHVLALSLLLQGLGESLVHIDIGDVAVLEDNAEVLELLIQILDHLTSHLALQVEDLTQPDTVNECTDTLINFRIEKLVEAAGPQAIHEILHFALFARHAEREVQIDIDVGIVFSRTVVDLSK